MALTPRPRVPLLVRAAVVGSLTAASLGCSGDDTDSSADSDVAPTAGPCVHADGSNLPECQTSGLDGMTTLPTGMDSAMDSTMDSTMSASGSATTTDVPPTAGPCVHADGSQLPECQTTGTVDETTAADSGSDSGSETGGTSTGGSSTSTG